MYTVMFIKNRLFYSKSGECNGFEEGNEGHCKNLKSNHTNSPESRDVENDESACVMSNHKKKCSELIMTEQLISECQKKVEGGQVSHLTFMQYEQMDSDEKVKIQNRVRQWVMKARDSLPNDHGLFCLVMAHLLKNAHRYFHLEVPSEIQQKVLESRMVSDATKEKVIQNFKDVSKQIQHVRDLKSKNRLSEQQEVIAKLKKNYHSFRNLSFISGVSLKTVHSWCSKPEKKIHKGKEMANERKKEFERFLLQDNISYEHPSKKYNGKCFLRDTLEIT